MGYNSFQKMHMFYLEQTEGDWAGFMTGQGFVTSSGQVVAARFEKEPDLRLTRSRVFKSYLAFLDMLRPGEYVRWIGEEADPVQDMIQRQLAELGSKRQMADLGSQR